MNLEDYLSNRFNYSTVRFPTISPHLNGHIRLGHDAAVQITIRVPSSRRYDRQLL